MTNPLIARSDRLLDNTSGLATAFRLNNTVLIFSFSLFILFFAGRHRHPALFDDL